MIRDPVEHDPITEHRYREAVAMSEFWRQRYHDEIRAFNKVQRESDCMALEMDFVRAELGEERWAELVEKYHALHGAALRQTTGYAYTPREGVAA